MIQVYSHVSGVVVWFQEKKHKHAWPLRSKLRSGTVPLLPHSIGQSKSQGQPRLMGKEIDLPLDGRICKVPLQRPRIQRGQLWPSMQLIHIRVPEKAIYKPNVWVEMEVGEGHHMGINQGWHFLSTIIIICYSYRGVRDRLF